MKQECHWQDKVWAYWWNAGCYGEIYLLVHDTCRNAKSSLVGMNCRAPMWGFSADFIESEPADCASVDNMCASCCKDCTDIMWLRTHHTITMINKNFLVSCTSHPTAVLWLLSAETSLYHADMIHASSCMNPIARQQQSMCKLQWT